MRDRAVAEKEAGKKAITVFAGKGERYGHAVWGLAQKESDIPAAVLSILRLGLDKRTMENPVAEFVAPAGLAEPVGTVPAGAPPRLADEAVIGGEKVDMRPPRRDLRSAPRTVEADALAALLVYVVLKEPTDKNWRGASVLRPKALNARVGDILRLGWVNGPDSGFTLARAKAVYAAFGQATIERQALCYIVYNCLVLPSTPMAEAISSQAHLLAGSGVSSVVRAGLFVCAFPDVVDRLPQLRSEAAEVVAMLGEREKESGAVQAFGGQMYRDGYYTVTATRARVLATISILLERKVSTSAENIVLPLADGDMKDACIEVANGLAAVRAAQMARFAEEAAKLAEGE